MKPYLVRVRVPGVAGEQSAMTIYVAMSNDETSALAAAREHLSNSNAKVEEVIGQAAQTVVDRLRIQPGQIVQLGG